MKMTVACVGKLKERFFQQAQQEYAKRLSRFCQLNIREVSEEKAFDDAPATVRRVREAEGKRLISAVSGCDTVIALSEEGVLMNSVEFAQKLRTLRDASKSVAFVIGGSNGLSDEVKEGAALLMSFSKMTFPHQLFRVMLLEQIYRACKINAREVYHK